MQAACRKDICAAYSNSQVLNLGASARQLLVQQNSPKGKACKHLQTNEARWSAETQFLIQRGLPEHR